MSVRLGLMSDLHLEFHRDGGQSFIADLDPGGVDVLVLAGDVCSGHLLRPVLAQFCAKYSQVVYVLGNHEYYGYGRRDVRRFVERACREQRNFHWLDNSACEVSGVHFVGGTMWFREAPSAPKWALNDFVRISNLERWLYKENADCLEKFGALVRPGSVVVTHHLPSYRSVHKKYAGSELNPFFVCDVESTLLTKGPALWCHGHTHETANYMVGPTRVVCNPFGYLYIEENPLFDKHLVLELPVHELSDS